MASAFFSPLSFLLPIISQGTIKSQIAISNFLNVSIDELFEADKKAERLQKIKNEINQKYYNGFISETVELCRNTLKEFPNDYNIMYNLLCALCWNWENNKDEITELGDRILNDCGEYELKIMTIRHMITYTGCERSRAVEMAQKLPDLQFGINNSKEKMLSVIGDGNDRLKYERYMVMALGNEFCSEINSLAETYFGKEKDDYVLTADKRILMREKALEVLNIIYDDGDYGTNNLVYKRIYQGMAKDYMYFKKNEKALDCLEKSANCCIAVENNTVFTHTSLLVNGMENHILFYNHGNPATLSYIFIHDYLLKEDVYAPIRETERFKAVIAKLEQYAKSEKTE